MRLIINRIQSGLFVFIHHLEKAHLSVEYPRRFPCWWGLPTFGLGLGSRRSADNDLRDRELAILHHLND